MPTAGATEEFGEAAYELNWFQDQFSHLHREITAEQEQWAEESGHPQEPRPQDAREPP